LLFDGTNDNLSLGYTSNILQPNTTFFVAKVDAANTGQIIDDTFASGGTHRQLASPLPGGVQMFAGTGPVGGSACSTSAFVVFQLLFNGASSFWTQNGTSLLASNVGTQDWGVVGILGSAYNGSNPYKGYIAEVLIYSTDVGSTNGLSIRQSLYTKYGLTGT